MGKQKLINSTQLSYIISSPFLKYFVSGSGLVSQGYKILNISKMSNKITTEIRYKDMSFDFIREVKGMKMYFNKDCSYAIIVNKDEEVLFELRADCGQNTGFLEDGLD